MLIFTIIACITFVPWFALEFRAGREGCFLSGICVRAIVFSGVQICLTVLVLGTLGMVKLPILIGVHTLVALWLLRWINRWQTAQLVQDLYHGLKDALIGIAGDVKRAPGLGLVVGSASIIVGLCGIYSGFLPVYRWDALAYHLPIAAGIGSTGSLLPLPQSYSNIVNFLGTPHLLYGWLAALSHDSHLLSLMHWIGWCVAGLAAYHAMRILKVSCLTAAFAAGVAMMSPVYLKESLVPYVDLWIAAGFLAMIGQGLEWIRNNNERSFAAFTCSTGFLWGLKLHTFTLVPLPLIFLGLYFGRNGLKRLRLRHLSWVMLAVTIGSFWMVYKGIHFDNPFYPFRIKLCGKLIFDGPQSADARCLTPRHPPASVENILARSMPGSLEKLALTGISWMELGSRDHSLIHQKFGGFGVAFTVILIPLAVGGVISDRRLAWALIGMFIILALNPLLIIARYMSFVPLVVSIAAGLGLSNHKRWIWILPIFSLLLVISLSFWAVDLAPDFSIAVRKIFIKEILRCELGIGGMLLALPIILAGLCWKTRCLHWQVFFFILPLATSVMLSGVIPAPAALKSTFGQEEGEKVFQLLETVPLSVEKSDLEQAKLAARAGLESGNGDITGYTGKPFPPCEGLMWNRQMTNTVMLMAAAPENAVKIGSVEGFTVYQVRQINRSGFPQHGQNQK